MRIRPSKALTFLAVLLLALVLAGAAQAQSLVVAVCGTLPLAFKPGAVVNNTVDVNGNTCISGSISATSSATAGSSVPSLTAGSQNFQEELSGGLFVHPVFGPLTAGNATPVDSTHGLPVNIVAGGGSGGTASSFAAAFPATGTAIGVKSGANMVNLVADGSNNLDVNLQTAIPAGANTIGGVTQATSPWVDNVTTWAGGTLGAMANYGTSPGAVLVPGVNAFITNTPTVTANAGTNLNTSALALDTSVNGLLLGQGSTTSGQKGPLVQGAVTTAAPSYTTAQTSPLSLDTSGLLRLSIKDTPSNTNNLNVNLAASAATVTTSPPSNASTNVTQFGGVNISTGTGAGGTGIPRVTISNDSSLAANQSVNLAQVAGATTNTGNGTAAGDQRVAIASDNSNSAGIGGSATGSAVPTAARYIGGNGSGNLTGITVCDNWTAISQTSNTQIITGAASKQTYICHVHVVTATAQNVALLSGTGSTCGTSPHAIAGGTTAATGWNFAANGGIVIGTGVGAPLRTGTAADNVCLFQSGSGQVSGAIEWTQF